ncbi:MOSC domain-containing protein [Actinomycetospora cinnamomea]|uniref:MOSC domain-containing protein YiiM n=1 Tax=Actinomycetospora cinnamomea TaxID=663609 RepID=A0A2U1FLW6_9PSEU|nr:MOSC domain-containing protein [Actinomycetospora cinnamomea]PVZ13164.1 MOSC domain-containing protein YiiM [Actinomycetospora cinnamomea]
MTPFVRTVAVGRPRDVPGPRDSDTTRTAIRKHPVDGPVEVCPENLAGDEQADTVHHGGPDKAVYAYGEEDLAWWRAEHPEYRALDDQVFGQNLTTVGHDLRGAVVGERWRVGTAEFEVAQPRTPCFKLGLRAGDGAMPRRFTAAVRPGVYLRVTATGTITSGDALHVVDRPAHGVTVAEVFAIVHHERHRAARLLEVPELPASYHDWARRRLAHA